MDLNNKSPPEKQDELEYMYYVGHEWEYDFNIGYGADLLEEDVLNVKCCLEVLRRLISKADAEIEELEEDLVILQTQLEWNEQNKHEDCSEICCNALREKIHFLELSIQCLKGEVMRKDDNSIPSQDREPAKRILEIINALLKNHIHKKDEQPEDVAVNDSRSDFHELGDLGDLHTVKRLINSDSQTCSVEEGNELGDLHTVQNFDLYLPVKSDIVTMNNNSETVKVQRTGCVTTGNTDSGSPLNLQGHFTEDATIKSEAKEMQACGTSVTDNDDNVRLSLELREWKSKSQSEQIMAQVSALVPPLESNFAMFSQSEGKQKQPGIPPYHLSNPRYPGKKGRRTDQPIPSVAEMLNCVAYSGSKISLNRPSISQVKRSKCAIFPPRGEEEEPNANTGPLPVPGVNDPNSLTVDQLKKYAKHQGLKRYSKLSKASLIDYLRKMGYLG